ADRERFARGARALEPAHPQRHLARGRAGRPMSARATEQPGGLRRQWGEEGRGEGREEGRAEGLELGIKRGRVDTLLSLLQLKFGDIDEARREQIASASLEELERWSRRILSATSLEEVLD